MQFYKTNVILHGPFLSSVFSHEVTRRDTKRISGSVGQWVSGSVKQMTDDGGRLKQPLMKSFWRCRKGLAAPAY